MSVATPHPQYDAHIAQWKRQRDCLLGEDAVKAAGVLYLPKLEGHDDPVHGEADYAAYVKRSMFYSATDRTVKGLTGYLMNKPPELGWPESQLSLLEDLGVGGESLAQLQQLSGEEVLGLGRFGLLVDSTDARDRPSALVYYAENVVSWLETMTRGYKEPARVVLREDTWEVDPKDTWSMKKVEQYRVLLLGVPEVLALSADQEETARQLNTDMDEVLSVPNGVYYQELWRKQVDEHGTELGDKWERTKTILPRKKGGKLLDYIPFVVMNAMDCQLRPTKGPMLDMVNVNLSHYRNSADLEHGRHWTALPTAWAAGFETAGELRVGSAVAWTTEISTARAGYLEFTGAGLGHLQQGMESKERLMAVLGARLLEQNNPGVEAAETVQLRHAGDKSVLATIAGTLSEGWTKFLRYYADWSGIANPEAVTCEFNTDFLVVGLQPDLLVKLMLGVQQGLLSFETWFYNLQRGELVPDGRTLEDELKAIEAGGPHVLPEKGEGDDLEPKSGTNNDNVAEGGQQGNGE